MLISVDAILQSFNKSLWIKRGITLLFGLIIWNLPIPWDLSEEAWQLFVIFISAILSVLIGGTSIFTASIIALVLVVLFRVLTPEKAFSGFSEGFILLILSAFLVAKGVIKSGLGSRIAFLLIGRFGHSTLRLSYCLVITDTLLGPAIPSNTARSGIEYPITHALALDTGSEPGKESRKNTGAFLCMSVIAGQTISSALWLTGMASNPIGAAMAADFGVNNTFGSWLVVASLPCLVGLILLPYMLYRLFPPNRKYTPEAPPRAKEKLKEMGPMSSKEWIMALTFVGMIIFWILSPRLDLNLAIIAFAGLAVLLLSGVYNIKDIRSGTGDALETYVWFAILYMMSAALNEMGFMKTLGI
ncbi:MAG: DASS family sodium-coupled anion symporter, partial [Saprospiraceae bacterium]|nr:DASS family sodium-coupled anion symporter [Saprospiraceae bacterium]